MKVTRHDLLPSSISIQQDDGTFLHKKSSVNKLHRTNQTALSVFTDVRKTITVRPSTRQGPNIYQGTASTASTGPSLESDDRAVRAFSGRIIHPRFGSDNRHSGPLKQSSRQSRSHIAFSRLNSDCSGEWSHSDRLIADRRRATGCSGVAPPATPGQ